MKKLVIVFALLMVLSGGTISVMKALQVGPFAPDEDEVVEKEEPLPEAPHFLELDQLLIPIFSDDRVVTTIQVQVQLEITGMENLAKINRLKPRLSDAFLRDLHAFIPRLFHMKERLTVSILKQRMQMIGDKVAGPGIIDSVLVQSLTDMNQQRKR